VFAANGRMVKDYEHAIKDCFRWNGAVAKQSGQCNIGCVVVMDRAIKLFL